MTASDANAFAPAAFIPDSSEAWRRLVIALGIASVGSVGMWSVVVALPKVQADFGGTRADASLAFTFAMLGFGIGNLLMGQLADRRGIVPAIVLGVVSLLMGYLAAAISTTLWQFALVHVAIGFGSSATFGPLMAEASHWFIKRRGIAVTIAASGNYLGGAIWPPIIEHSMGRYG